MNRRTEPDSLLDDVVAEALPEDFRQALLDTTLRRVRRRRQIRRARRVGVAVVVLVAAIGLGRYARVQTEPVANPKPMIYEVVTTQPIPETALITTTDEPPLSIVTSVATIAVVRTTPHGFRLIGDQELLLVAARPAALIRIDAQSQALLFFDSDGAKRVN